MMALGLCSLLTLAPMMNLNAQAEQEPLRGSVMKSEEHQNPSINPDDIKTLEEGSKLEMTLTTTMSTSSVTQGDEFFAKISKDYSVDGKVVIPRGSLIHGTIGEAKAPGLAGRKAYMTTNFDYLITPDGREIPIEGKYSNKDGGVKRAAKVVARTAGFGAVGGVAGAVMGLKYAGIGSAIASEGWSVAGPAAVGGVVGIVSALVTKGKHTMLEPGTPLSIKLTEPIDLPTMNIPDVEDSNYAPEGLEINVLAMKLGQDPFGEATEITLSLNMLNQTEHTFTFFDVALEDENGTLFYPSAFGDTGMWFTKFKPNTRVVGNLSFSVDNPMLQHHLVFFKRYTREPLAKIAIVSDMKVDKKTAKKRLKQAEKQKYSYEPEY